MSITEINIFIGFIWNKYLNIVLYIIGKFNFLISYEYNPIIWDSEQREEYICFTVVIVLCIVIFFIISVSKCFDINNAPITSKRIRKNLPKIYVKMDKKIFVKIDWVSGYFLGYSKNNYIRFLKRVLIIEYLIFILH